MRTATSVRPGVSASLVEPSPLRPLNPTVADCGDANVAAQLIGHNVANSNDGAAYGPATSLNRSTVIDGIRKLPALKRKEPNPGTETVNQPLRAGQANWQTVPGLGIS